MKNILFLSSLLIVTACSITLPKKFEPDFQPQTEKSLTHFLDSNKVIYDKADVATLKDTILFKKFGTKNTFSIPDAYFFNKEGYRVENNFKGKMCGHVITNADKINTAPTDKTEHINDWVKDFYFLENKDVPDHDYDATIIITWGMYTHKSAPSVNLTAFEWYKSIKQDYPDMKIRAIFLNLDLQRNWFISDEAEKAAATGNMAQ